MTTNPALTSIFHHLLEGASKCYYQAFHPERVFISPVNYRFFINERGIIDRFEIVDSASNSVIRPDLVDAINDRLESGVSFEPTIINGRSIRLVCDLVIDLSS